jgi:Domain of unknown function (DUF2703)
MADMKTLPITWKRLVKAGQTCPRCGSTERNLLSAIATLKVALRPLGIEPVLETVAIDEAGFRDDPSESNRIWIAGKPMEQWLGAGVGHSECCSACGDLPCRTVEVDGHRFEAIPDDLIVRAAVAAALSLPPTARSVR